MKQNNFYLLTFFILLNLFFYSAFQAQSPGDRCSGMEKESPRLAAACWKLLFERRPDQPKYLWYAGFLEVHQLKDYPAAVKTMSRAYNTGYRFVRFLRDYAKALKYNRQPTRAIQIYQVGLQEIQKGLDQSNVSNKWRKALLSLREDFLAYIIIEAYRDNQVKLALTYAKGYEGDLTDWGKRQAAKAYVWYAYRKLAERDYQAAFEGLTEAIRVDNLQRQTSGKQELPIEDIEGIRGLVQLRKRLGKIHPKITYKLLVVYFSKTDYHFRCPDPGPLYTGKRTITPKQRDYARVAWKLTQILVEAMSEGQMQLLIDYKEAPFVLRKLDCIWDHEENGKPIYKRSPALDSLPGMEEFMQNNAKKYDGFAWMFNGSDGIGGPYHQGGSKTYHLVREQLHIRRGWMSIRTHRRALTTSYIYLHEFFHNLESLMGISPMHGFWSKRRENFPDWKGRGEIDYYHYQFQKTLAQAGWTNVSYRKKYPIKTFLTDDVIERNRQAVAQISLDRRRKASAYLEEAWKYYRARNQTGLERVTRKGLDYNPANTGLLCLRALYFERRGQKQKAKEFMKKYVYLYPEPWAWKKLAYITAYGLGDYAGGRKYLRNSLKHERNPNTRQELYENLAYMHKKEGHKKEAAKNYRLAARLKNKDAGQNAYNAALIYFFDLDQGGQAEEVLAPHLRQGYATSKMKELHKQILQAKYKTIRFRSLRPQIPSPRKRSTLPPIAPEKDFTAN